MPEVIVAADADWIVDEVRAVLSRPGDVVRVVNAGALVLPAVQAHQPDLVILDLQIGSMGAMATCMDMRLEEGAGRLDHVPVFIGHRGHYRTDGFDLSPGEAPGACRFAVASR